MNELSVLLDYSVKVIQVTFGLFLYSVVSIYLSSKWGAPWIITPYKIIRRMLELTNLKPGDQIVDLGAGDGRILIIAAKEYNAIGFGVEIDPIRTLLAKLFIRTRRVHKKVDVHWGNIFNTNLHGIDLVTMYLTRETNKIIRSLLEEKCDPGTKIVSYAFPIPGWNPIIIDDFYLIFVYEVGKTGDDVIVRFI